MQESPSELPTMEAPIYIVDDGLEFLMDAFEDCSATTKRGRRCHYPISYGREGARPPKTQPRRCSASGPDNLLAQYLGKEGG